LQRRNASANSFEPRLPQSNLGDGAPAGSTSSTSRIQSASYSSVRSWLRPASKHSRCTWTWREVGQDRLLIGVGWHWRARLGVRQPGRKATAGMLARTISQPCRSSTLNPTGCSASYANTIFQPFAAPYTAGRRRWRPMGRGSRSQRAAGP